MKYLLFLVGLITTFVVSPLFAEVKVLAFAGSTRAGSYNKQLMQEAALIAQKMGGVVTVIDLKDYPMPLYDADREKEEGMPENAKRLQGLMIHSDAMIIAAPQYNGSVPPLLKNALDWCSRSAAGCFSNDAFKGKRFAIMSTSPGKGGGGKGLVHLRAIIEDVGGMVVEEQVSIPDAEHYFSENNRAENPLLQEEIRQLLGVK